MKKRSIRRGAVVRALELAAGGLNPTELTDL